VASTKASSGPSLGITPDQWSAQAETHRKEASASCDIGIVGAEASTTEEPDAGKPHVRACVCGGVGPAFIPQRLLSINNQEKL